MSRAVIALILFGTVMWFAITMLPGCAAPPDPALADVRPIYDSNGAARSLVADPPLIAPQQRQPGVTGQPWYVSRRDTSPQVIAGYRSPIYRSATTYTIDNVHTHSNGRVHDHYSQTTYRGSHIEIVE